MAPSSINELLESLDLLFLIQHFENNCIDLKMLLILNDSEIKELVPQIGARRKLTDFVKDYHKVHTGPNVISVEVNSSFELKPSTSSLSSASTVIIDKDEFLNTDDDGDDCVLSLDNEKSTVGSSIFGAGYRKASTSDSRCSLSLVEESEASVKSLSDSDSIVVEVADLSPPAKKLKGMRRFFPGELTLHDLIQQNSKLSMIRDIHISKGYLLESERRKLVAIVIDKLLDRHTSVTKEMLQELAKNICEEFPSECVSTYFYFNSAVSKNARGKLCDRYHNELKIRRQFRKSLSSESGAANSSASSSATKTVATCPISDEVQTKIKWLKHSQEPWETVILYWMETYQVRQDQTSNGIPFHQFIQNWPILQHDYGHQLVIHFSFFLYELKVVDPLFLPRSFST